MSALRWFREFGRPPRILGLDVARGLAILGMAGAHIGETEPFEWVDPATWTDLVHGRSSILFAVLAGVSIALITGRSALPDPGRLPGIRLNLLGRGAMIFVIGLALEMLNTPLAVILTLYGLLYVAVIPFLRWKPWQLLVAAGALALAGPGVLALISAIALQPYGAGLGFVLYGSYPITVWMAFVLGGMAFGRLRIDSIRIAVATLVSGVVLAVSGYGLGAIAPSFAIAEADPFGSALAAFFAVEPHSGGTAEILGSGGFALAVIGLCLLLSRPLRWALLPLGALGSMPLSAYSLHVVTVALLSGPGGVLQSNAFWSATAIGLLLLTTLWAMFFGRGPLERLVGWAAQAMAAVPRRPARSRVEA